MTIISGCPFCALDTDRVFHRETRYACLWDGYPVSKGHALIVPTRHFPIWFEATPGEQAVLLEGVNLAKRRIDELHKPDGYNIGINVGEAGGQTVDHLHIHVIPRYTGDVHDPRGGVRHVIPGKGNYLSDERKLKDGEPTYTELTATAAISGSPETPLLDTLISDMDHSSSIDLAVAFVTESGLLQIQAFLVDLLERGGRIRLLTGDYMDVTQPRALLRLHDLLSEYDALAQVKVFETDGNLGFHPKAYLLNQDYDGVVAYIGSSNLTKHALTRGLEWNQRIAGHSSDASITQIQAEFERLFTHEQARPLTLDWIAAYDIRRKPVVVPTSSVAVVVDEEFPPDAPEPHEIQAEALVELDETRKEGNQAGLVVMATGLGKTWLAAFDSEGFERVLFVAHREEILKQAMNTFRKIRPEATLGMYMGGEYDVGAEVVFASIQTLGRAAHLRQFDRERFDYIVIDEFHHAAAATYRRLIDHFDPAFLLGLTATPERTDGGDLLALCGENLVFRCDLVDGINRALLSPFQYFGVPDEVDFTNIPWRSGRFDPEQLEFAVATEKRAQNALDQWRKRSQTRTLAFCVSKRHADFMADYFISNGVKAVSVHSGPSAAPRTRSLQQLEAGGLQVVFAVDMFNEGVDVPAIDTVMMLRPTESKILWLQQFGRGLRKADNKSHLSVIDYIGNHRSFLQVPAVLLPGAGSKPGEIHQALLKLETGDLSFPAGCSVEYELEALSILKQLSRPVGVSEQMTYWYRSFRELNGRRPLAVEAFHEGYGPKNVRAAYGSWMGFVKSEGDLNAGQSVVFDKYRQFIEQTEKTQMTRSFKMVVLQAMLAAGQFPGAIGIDELAHRVQSYVNRLKALKDDFGLAAADSAQLKRLLEENPIKAWIGGRGTGGKTYFSYTDGSFQSFEVDAVNRDALAELVQEIVDWRIAQYLDRTGSEDTVHHDIRSRGQLALWQEYMREEIPPLWDLKFSAAKWQQGFVRDGDNIFLLVSLNKSGMADAHQYADKFISPDEFQWLSQNRTKRESPVGQSLKNHKAAGTKVHLFVRDRRKTPKGKAAPFVYCGQVAFVSWEGDKPITVVWRMGESLPSSLSQRFGL